MTRVLITGANRGIGFALAKEYAQEGASVIATCRAPDEATDLRALAALHPKLRIEALDLSDAESRKALAARLANEPLDILINNAGILSGADASLSALDEDPSQTFGSLDAESWARVLWVNTIAPVILTETLMPNLRLGREKKVIMMSSSWGSISQAEPDHFAYRSSKAALNAAMRCMALDLQKDGFVVVSLNPGWVRTRMGGKEAAFSPQESAMRLVRLVGTLRPDRTGQFFSHNGEQISW